LQTVQEQSRKRSAERDLIMTHLVQSQAITLALASLIASQASGPMQPRITSLINSLSALPALPAASPPAAIPTVVDTITPAAAGATPSSADPPKSTADTELIPDADEDILVTIPPKIARK
jgi:hypothetical protein